MNRWLILFCAFLLFAGILIGEDKTTIEKLTYECSSGNQEACKKLVEIAKSDKDSAVREAAVERLTDQTVLARIALEDFDVGHTALKNLADQSALVKVAADDKDWRVRLIFMFITAFDSVPAEHRERLMMQVLPVIRVLSYPAVVSAVGDIVSIETEWESRSHQYQRIWDESRMENVKGEIFKCSINIQKLPEPLSHIWSTDFPYQTSFLGFVPADVYPVDLLRKPFEKLTDQSVLAEFARNNSDPGIREAASNNLTDKSVLADIAKNAADWRVRKVAVEKLTDQIALADIAKKDQGIDVRLAAVIKLTDMTVLADIAKNINEYGYVREAALKKLNDQAVLADIYRNDKNADIRQAAVKRLSEDHPLRQVVLASKEEVEKLSDQALLADIAKNVADWRVREAAVKKLIDQVLLADIAKNDELWGVRMAAAEKLIDQTVAQSVYADIAKNDNEWIVREAAVEKLTNQSVLSNIARSDKDSVVRNAAERRLKELRGK